MKIEQKIVTVGTSKTSTPRLYPRINLASFVLVSTALHIEHCANATPLDIKVITNPSSKNTKRLITVPLVQALQAVPLCIDSAALKIGRYRGRIQRAGLCRPPASAQLSVSNSVARISSA